MEYGINWARRSPALITSALNLADVLGCTWGRTSGQLAFIRPDDPAGAPDYTIIDDLAAKFASAGLKAWLMLGQAGPWPYSTAAGSNLSAWGWNVAYPGSGSGYDRWGAKDTGGATVTYDTTAALPVYSGSAADAFGSYYRFRMPSSAWAAWAEVYNLAMARFVDRYIFHGGLASNVVFEVSNECAGPHLYDEHYVQWHNDLVDRLIVPAGAGLATDGWYGIYSQGRLSDEIASHTAFIDDACARLDLSRFGWVSFHAYLNRRQPWDTYASEYAEKVRRIVEHMRSKPDLDGKALALTEFGVQASFTGHWRQDVRGAYIGLAWNRIAGVAGLDLAMLWSANTDDAVWGLVYDGTGSVPANTPSNALLGLYGRRGIEQPPDASDVATGEEFVSETYGGITVAPTDPYEV